MKFLLLVALLLTNICLADTVIGKGASKKNVVKISTLLKTPKQYIDKEVTIEGTIVKVCARSGCKMFFASDKKHQDLMIKAKSKKMTFPLSARGKKALAKGTFIRFPSKKDHKDCEEDARYMVSATGALILE